MSFYIYGGNEQSTHKYVSELLGKETINFDTYVKSRGRSGNYTTNYQIVGRELMTPDEVRLLDNKYALLFIRGERPIIDLKYDILKHPNLKYTPDGTGEVYTHNSRIVKEKHFNDEVKKQKINNNIEEFEKDYEILSSDEIEERIKNGGFEKYER